MLGNWGKEVTTDLLIFLARDNLPGLVNNLASNAINKFKRKISGKEVVSAGKGFISFILNEDVNKIIKTIESLKDSNELIHGINETVKHRIKKTRRPISSCFVSTFGCFISATSDFFSTKRYKWKRSKKSWKWIYKEKFLVPLHPLSNTEITKYLNCQPRLNDVFSRGNLPKIKDGTYVKNLDDKKVTKYIGFHYLVIEIQLHTLIILELNILQSNY